MEGNGRRDSLSDFEGGIPAGKEGSCWMIYFL